MRNIDMVIDRLNILKSAMEPKLFYTYSNKQKTIHNLSVSTIGTWITILTSSSGEYVDVAEIMRISNSIWSKCINKPKLEH